MAAPKRRARWLWVCCVFCGVRLHQLAAADYQLALGTCWTCVYRVGAGKVPGV